VPWSRNNKSIFIKLIQQHFQKKAMKGDDSNQLLNEKPDCESFLESRGINLKCIETFLRLVSAIACILIPVSLMSKDEVSDDVHVQAILALVVGIIIILSSSIRYFRGLDGKPEWTMKLLFIVYILLVSYCITYM
jgi:hypothetical protein